jgi:hypothetical protein
VCGIANEDRASTEPTVDYSGGEPWGGLACYQGLKNRRITYEKGRQRSTLMQSRGYAIVVPFNLLLQFESISICQLGSGWAPPTISLSLLFQARDQIVSTGVQQGHPNCLPPRQSIRAYHKLALNHYISKLNHLHKWTPSGPNLPLTAGLFVLLQKLRSTSV